MTETILDGKELGEISSYRNCKRLCQLIPSKPTYLGFADVCVEGDHCLFPHLKQDLTVSLLKMNCETAPNTIICLFTYLLLNR